MKITANILQQQWEKISYRDGGFLQIDTQHPLEWHIGYESTSRRTLLLVCDIKIDAIESSKSIVVNRRLRELDNRWTLSFELLQEIQQDVFSILCCDIIEYSRAASSEEKALISVIGRYKQWCHLLESQKRGLMDEKIRKGLLGELLFLEQYIDHCNSPLTAVLGWVGADGLDQDFMYSERWYEVKSIGISSTSITISSLEQLDCTQAGELVIVYIDKVSPSKSDAFSLNEVVYRISSKFSSDIDALLLFQNKLTAYGYIDLQEYSEKKYYFHGMKRYEVIDLFPRITSKSVPTEVISLSYELSLPALEKWLKG